MRDFATRFSAALSLSAFGVAGFVSMVSGSLVTTSLLRGAAAGAVFFVFGRLLAAIVFNGPITPPSASEEGRGEKEKER